MTKTDEATTVMRLLDLSPAMLGLLSPTGECLLMRGKLRSAQHLSPDSPPRAHLKDVFPFVSQAADFWQKKLTLATEGSNPVHFDHLLGDRKLRLVLFPCTFPEHGPLSSVGIIALELPEEESRSSQKGPLDPSVRRMLSVLGHELRNPLSAIGAGLRVLEMRPKNVPAESVTSMMKRQLEQASRLVNDLLDATRLNRAGLALSLKDELLSEVITLSLDGVQHRLGAKKHTLSVDIPDEPVNIRCDLGRLSQAVTNLLHNACKYTPDGGHIALSVRRSKGEVVISVSDTGAGIPRERLDSIFEPFTQVHESMSLSDGGVGLGLFIVKAIVNGHGGTVRASSDGKGRGAVFMISIPAAGSASPSFQ